MQLKSHFTLTCDCNESFNGDSIYAVIEKLMRHTVKAHPIIFEKLQIEGRKLAMCQNGCGYFDDGESASGGWHKATSGFRHTWIKEALKFRIQNV